jgi:hypothetical protein
MRIFWIYVEKRQNFLFTNKATFIKHIKC